MTAPRFSATVGGWSVTARPGKVWLHDTQPGRDGDLAPAEALELGEALAAAALAAGAALVRPLDADHGAAR